jgi:hypothetical protein
MMEEQELVTRAERVGILTTSKGTQKIVSVMAELYPQNCADLMGSTIFGEVVRMTRPEEQERNTT